MQHRGDVYNREGEDDCASPVVAEEKPSELVTYNTVTHTHTHAQHTHACTHAHTLTHTLTISAVAWSRSSNSNHHPSSTAYQH